MSLAEKLPKTKFIGRLVELDRILRRARIAAYHNHIFSLSNISQVFRDNHRELIDEFNAKKFWFIRKRKYEI